MIFQLPLKTFIETNKIIIYWQTKNILLIETPPISGHSYWKTKNYHLLAVKKKIPWQLSINIVFHDEPPIKTTKHYSKN